MLSCPSSTLITSLSMVNLRRVYVQAQTSKHGGITLIFNHPAGGGVIVIKKYTCPLSCLVTVNPNVWNLIKRGPESAGLS